MADYSELMKLEKKPHPPLSSPRNEAISPIEAHTASLLANQQRSKSVSQQVGKPVHLLTSKEANKHTVLSTNQQINKSAQKLTTKDKQKIGSYLTPESWIELQTIAARTQRKDHEVLQEAVDLYLESLQK